ncbi:MAG: putative glutamine amidotransferase [Myxococcota bacterium]|nr:putative glutamine amidotransferase [Myxococcota bacterium]
MAQPLIGVTPDFDPSHTPDFSTAPRYVVKEAYVDAVIRAGGLPIILTYVGSGELLELMSNVDGLLITGGRFDIDPARYGQQAVHRMDPGVKARMDFEWKCCEFALWTGLPLLGICGGAQLINVVAGGALIQDIPSQVSGALQHEQPHDRRRPQHPIEIAGGTKLSRILGFEGMDVNSTHHQAVAGLGENVVASAHAPDGVVEAIELTNHPFAVGVQWHPELMADQSCDAIYGAFIRACRRRPR